MKDGFYKALPMPDYLNEDALSKSGLVELSRSPAHFKAAKEFPKESAAFDLGTAVHALVLEPDRAAALIVTPPAEVLAKNGYRTGSAYKAWEASRAPGAVILKADDFDAARRMADAVLSHPAARDMLTAGHPEVSAFWTDANGVRRKCRPDYLNDFAAIDLKTTIDASPEGFGKQAFNLKYYWSAFWTTEIIRGLGGGSRPYVFIASEKTPPYPVAVYETPQELIDRAREEIAPLLDLYRDCLKADQFPGYHDVLMTLQVPRWAKKWEEE